MSLLNQSGDLIAGWGTNAAIRTAIQAERDSARLGAFVSMSGGWSRYDTGCHADLSSISLMVGVSRRVELELGNLAFGAFFEYGNGSYDTYAAVHGDGDLYHLGGGLIGHMDFTKTGSGHFYTEASVRAGGVENDYRHSGLYDSWGREATYDASSAYYGIHLGVGYLWRMTDKAGLDLYGKYFWTRQEGDAVRLSAGEPVDFDSLNSHRLSMGTRFNYAVLERLSPYVGVAYDHEFAGDTSATVRGYKMGEPYLKGVTGALHLRYDFWPYSLIRTRGAATLTALALRSSVLPDVRCSICCRVGGRLPSETGPQEILR